MIPEALHMTIGTVYYGIGIQFQCTAFPLVPLTSIVEVPNLYHVAGVDIDFAYPIKYKV